MNKQELLELAAPKLHEKRVDAVSIRLSNTIFYATVDANHNIVGGYVDQIPGNTYNLCTMLGYDQVVAR